MENIETTKNILSSVCDIFEVEISEVRSKSRVGNLPDSRKAIIYILKKYFKRSISSICKEINKNHCIIAETFRTAEALMQTDKEFKIKMDRIIAANGLDMRLCPCCGRPYDKIK